MVGFITTTDPRRARSFYEGLLGFRFVSQDDFALVVETERNRIRIAPVPSVSPAPHTVLGWEVEAIGQTVRALAGRGVRFERYPGLTQDADGIWAAPGGARVAWFRDPDGNVLSISEHPAE
jgi:catechol 2,3-dioxygenase-like lactoylglutathione lyase family enzyme